jgi:DNA-binding LytR/AlgR family response regulator
VNLDHVREIRGDPHGDGVAILANGGTVRISRARRDAIARALEQHALAGGK